MEFSEDNLSESNFTLLLQIIKAGADVDALLTRGLQFSQIAELISEALDKGFAKELENKLELTQLGIEKVMKGATGNKLIRGGWISPLEEFRIEKLPLDAIYLPYPLVVEYDIAESLASSRKLLE